MMLMALDNAPGQPFTVGEWSGWEGERNSLAASLHANGLRNLAAFSGDIPRGLRPLTACGLTPGYGRHLDDDSRIDGAPNGTEFVAGSMTSSGIAESFGGQGELTDQVRLLNPHIAYANTVRRGYAVVEATADELKVAFRSPATIKQPASPMETLRTFTVARDEPGPE